MHHTITTANIDAIAIENRARALRAEATRAFFQKVSARLRGERLPAARHA